MSEAIASGRRIVCFGEALIDFLAKAGSPRTFVEYAGGAPANVAAAIGRLGGDVSFVGMLGSDMFGDFLLESLQGMGVDTRHTRRSDKARTALAFVALDAQGERSFSFYRPPAADLEFRAEHFADDVFVGASALHVCSNSLTEAGIARATLDGVERAREAGALISFDMNYRPSLWPPGVDPLPRLWEVLEQADVIKLAGNELAVLAGEGPVQPVFERLWSARARCIVVTDGAAPVVWRTKEGGHGELPSFRMNTIDTTAAGDAFVGGLLFQLAQANVDAGTLPAFLSDATRLESALRFAVAVGGLTVTRHGAFAAMPSREEVEHLLLDHAVAV